MNKITKSSITIPAAPAGASLSSWYSVTINNQKAPVWDARVDNPHNCAFITFDFSGSVKVTVTSKKKFEKHIVRPLSAGIKAKVSGKSITFSLTEARQYCVEFDGDLTRPLLIFANEPEKNVPKADMPGVRWFGPGIHTPGEIKLMSGDTVYIAGGAVVRGWFTSENAQNVVIRGRGIMDAHENKTSMIRMKDCQDVLVEGIIIADQPTFQWTTSFWCCDQVSVKNIKIVAGDNVSNDGIDIVSCTRFTVDGCFVKCFDDAVVIKALRTNRREVKDVVIKNCLLWNIQAYSVAIGAELDAPEISNILVKNIDCIHAAQVETDTADMWLYYSAVLGIMNGDDALVHDIRYEDIRVEDGINKLISIKLMKTQWNAHTGYGEIRDITYKNIKVIDGKFLPSEILSYGIERDYSPGERKPVHIPENITIENLEILGKKITNAQEGGFIINPFVRNLKFTGISKN